MSSQSSADHDVTSTLSSSSSPKSSAAIPPPPPPPPPPDFLSIGIPPPPPPPPPDFLSIGIPPPPPPPPPDFLNVGIPPPPPPPGLGPGIPPPPPSISPSLISPSDPERRPFRSGGNFSSLPPPPPPPGGPMLMPAPPVGGWNQVYHTARKPQIHPRAPMKPLFWSRIQILNNAINSNHTVDSENSKSKKTSTTLWEEIEEEAPDDWQEFEKLFSRQVITRKVKKKDNDNNSSKSKERANLLDSKRAHNINILVTSMKLEIPEIENAVYNFDTSLIDTEKLQKIHDIYASPEELKKIENHVKNSPNIPLGKPEQFLYDLSRIPCFSERVSCLMFEIQFAENISNIEARLNNFKNVCNCLMTNLDLKNVFAIILSLGNYMNGGNRDRGQADGFGLEILPKLKEVKSTTDCSITLLHFVVKLYFDKHVTMDELMNTKGPRVKLPVPEPQDLKRASLISFDDISKEIQDLHSSLKSVEAKIKKVTNYKDEEDSENNHVEPFKSRMENFLERAFKLHNEQEENLRECKEIFPELMDFFRWKPKCNKDSEICKELFQNWIPFCSDFKDIFNKELNRRIKSELERLKRTVEEKQSKMKVPKEARKTSSSRKEKIANFFKNLDK